MPFIGSYPLATSDGEETYLGISGDGEVQRYVKPAENRYFTSRSQIAASNIPTGIVRLMTGGFSTENDGGWAFYIPQSIAPADTANPFYVQSLDAKWWRLEVDSPGIKIEQLGGKGDN